MVTAAVNVMDVPAQADVALEVMLTVGVTEVFTLMVSALEVAVFVSAQAALLVITQVTTSLLFKVAEV